VLEAQVIERDHGDEHEREGRHLDGTDVMILKIFSPKNWRNVFSSKYSCFCKNLIMTLVFKKNAIFPPKIAIICDHNIGLWRDPMILTRAVV
jgi:hypothetical protein